MAKQSQRVKNKKQPVASYAETPSASEDDDYDYELEEVEEVPAKRKPSKRALKDHDYATVTDTEEENEVVEEEKRKKNGKRARKEVQPVTRLTRTKSKKSLEGEEDLKLAEEDTDTESEAGEGESDEEEEEGEEEESIFKKALSTLPAYVRNPAAKRNIRQMRLRRTEPMTVFSAIKDELESQGDSLHPLARKLLKQTIRAIKNGPPEKKRDPSKKFKPAGKIIDKNLKTKVVLKNVDTSLDLSCRFLLGNNYVLRTGVIEYSTGKKASVEKEIMRVLSIVRLPHDPTKAKDYRFNIPLRYVS